MENGLTYHPLANEVASCTKMAMTTTPVMAIPSAAISTDVIPTAFNRGPFRHIRSSSPMMNKFTRFAPRAFPAARSGSSTRRMELSPVASSGSDVAVASKTTPTKVRPRPVLKAMTSADFTRKCDAARITEAVAASSSHRRPTGINVSWRGRAGSRRLGQQGDTEC